jgi:GT2 family glycosyltransferase
MDGHEVSFRQLLKLKRRAWSMHVSDRFREGIGWFAPRATTLLVDTAGVAWLPGVQPLIRLALHNRLQLIAPFVDPDFYLRQIKSPAARQRARRNPALHYLLCGRMREFAPCADFDPKFYRKRNPNLHWAADPLTHFAKSELNLESLKRLRDGGSPRSLYDEPQPAPAAPRGRFAVYTAVVGPYDELHAPEFVPENCDFFVFSDQALDVPGWTTLPLNYEHRDPTRAARFVKLHPHLYFHDYEQSIWIDANITVRKDISPFLDRLSADSFLSIFVHPLRNCVYVEGEECIARMKDSAVTILAQLDRYEQAGFPREVGLWETNVLVRRHNDPACIALMTAWWRELEIGSRRDQLSLTVVAHRQQATITPLDYPGTDARRHPLLGFSTHLKRWPKLDAAAALVPAVRRTVDTDAISQTIGICVHNSLNDVRNCLDSLLLAVGAKTRIIIIDDGSEQETAEYLEVFAANDARIELRRHERALGYTRSANEILRTADSDWVILLNSDTVVPVRALHKLIQTGEQYPRLGIVGPLSNAASWQNVPELTGSDRKFAVNAIPDGLTVEDMDRICEEVSRGAVPFVPFVNGFCLAIRRAMLLDIGYFDERMFPLGYGEEDDLCLRAAEHGYVCGLATDTFILHAKSASFTSERREKLAAEAGKTLRRKYGTPRIAAGVATMRFHPRLNAIRRTIADVQAQIAAQRRGGTQRGLETTQARPFPAL